MRFEDLGLSEPILRAVTAEGYTVPTPIQTKAIPHVLQGRDLLGCAQTGTGKTAAFALPILHRLSQNHHNTAKSRPRLSTLVLAPTRELAAQIADSFCVYGKHLRLKHTVIFGGVSQFHQVKALKAGVDVLIATPGRLLDLMNQGHVDIRHVEIFVLDEADRMLDMGFIPDIRRIVKQLPRERQTLFFSATMPSDIRQLADSILNNPVSVQVTPVSSTVKTISQSVYFVTQKSKPALLTHLLRANGPGRTLVFTRTKHGADKVVKHLDRAGIDAAAIHGNKSQNARTRALARFKSTLPPVLVATDIASRGIDVDDVTHVINFDLPDVPETYVHRIGRTARAGASGIAVTFCGPEQRNDLKIIERLTKQNLAINPMPTNLSLAVPDNAATVDRTSSNAEQLPRTRKPQRNRSSTSSATHNHPHASKPHHPQANQPRRGWQQRGRAQRPIRST